LSASIAIILLDDPQGQQAEHHVFLRLGLTLCLGLGGGTDAPIPPDGTGWDAAGGDGLCGESGPPPPPEWPPPERPGSGGI